MTTVLTGETTRPGRYTAYIVTHYFLTNLGYFGLLSTLVVSLNAAGFDAGRIALLVMVFTLSNKIAKIPLAPWLDRFPAAMSVLLGCLTAAAGFLGLRYATGLPLTAASLAIAGTGVSINALASKQLAAAASDHATSRARTFSLINIGINVAAAVSAPLALLFVARDQHGRVLLGVAAVYILAGTVTYLNHRSVYRAAQSNRPSTLGAYLSLLRIPGLPTFLVANLFGWMLYGQLFSVLALYVSETLRSPGRLGWLYTLNALLVVVAQLAVTRAAERWIGARQLVVSYVVFAGAFAAAYLVPGYAGAVVFVVVFTLAEMVFVPSVDVHLLGIIGPDRRAVGYGILSISTALGEAAGGGLGVAAYRWLAERHHGMEFWLVAAGVALGFALVTHLVWRSRPVAAG